MTLHELIAATLKLVVGEGGPARDECGDDLVDCEAVARGLVRLHGRRAERERRMKWVAKNGNGRSPYTFVPDDDERPAVTEIQERDRLHEIIESREFPQVNTGLDLAPRERAMGVPQGYLQDSRARYEVELKARGLAEGSLGEDPVHGARRERTAAEEEKHVAEIVERSEKQVYDLENGLPVAPRAPQTPDQLFPTSLAPKNGTARKSYDVGPEDFAGADNAASLPHVIAANRNGGSEAARTAVMRRLQSNPGISGWTPNPVRA